MLLLDVLDFALPGAAFLLGVVFAERYGYHPEFPRIQQYIIGFVTCLLVVAVNYNTSLNDSSAIELILKDSSDATVISERILEPRPDLEIVGGCGTIADNLSCRLRITPLEEFRFIDNWFSFVINLVALFFLGTIACEVFHWVRDRVKVEARKKIGGDE